MTIHPDLDDFEPTHANSSTADVLEGLQLHGYRPRADEPDPRPAPDTNDIETGMAEAFHALASIFTHTCLEPDLSDVLWSVINSVHHMAQRAQRDLDANEDAQKRSQAQQDGSEIRSVELEQLLAAGQHLIERRSAFEAMRDHGAELFELHTGSTWRPRAGSQVNHRAMTATLIDSREFLAAKRRSETEVMLPPGPKIAFTGGIDCNDHARIWDTLDRARAKHPEMVLLHGGSPKGSERIAACWADQRKVPQVVFKPDWNRHQKAAPFKRNDQMLAVLPIGVIVFPGSGISENLADKAKGMGIPVWRSAG